MQNNLQLAIPQPCHENWEQMTKEQQGRFCNACATTVIDFTSMSDEALLNFFKNKTSGDYCGRVLNIQLDRNLQVADSRKIPFSYAVLIFLILFFFTKQNNVKAQTTIAPDIYTVPFKGNHNTVKNIGEMAGTVAKNCRAISGKIYATNGNTIAGAFVKQVNAKGSFTTKQNGGFVFLVDEGIKQIQITVLGFETKLVTLTGEDHYEITLQPVKQICPPRPEIMGKIVIRKGNK